MNQGRHRLRLSMTSNESSSSGQSTPRRPSTSSGLVNAASRPNSAQKSRGSQTNHSLFRNYYEKKDKAVYCRDRPQAFFIGNFFHEIYFSVKLTFSAKLIFSLNIILQNRFFFTKFTFQVYLYSEIDFFSPNLFFRKNTFLHDFSRKNTFFREIFREINLQQNQFFLFIFLFERYIFKKNIPRN